MNNTWIGIKLSFRDRQSVFWSYAFPLFFLFLFAGVFARGRADMTSVMMPGLLCITAMSGGLFGMSIVLVGMRERGILRRYHLAPISPWLIISSQIAASFVTTISTLLLQLALARVIYKVTIIGNPAAFFLILVAGVLAFLAIGFIVASVADNARSAQVFANILFFPLMFLGGAAFPLQFLPPKLQNLARVLPSNYMVDGLYGVMRDGKGLRANALNLVVLLTSLAVSLLIAAKLFRWESNERLPAAKKAWVAAIVGVFIVAALWR